MTPDGKEVSFLTVHLYLNGDPIASRHAGPEEGACVSDEDRDNQPLVGGATRFFSWREEEKYFDYSPIMGSCIVFQHRDLVHSGEDVKQGTKYTMRTDVMYEKLET